MISLRELRITDAKHMYEFIEDRGYFTQICFYKIFFKRKFQ